MQKVILMNSIQEYSDYVDQSVIDYIADRQTETYESFGKFNLVAFDWSDADDMNSQPSQIIIYIDKDDLFYICENETAYKAAERFFAEDESNEHAMYLFFRNLFMERTDYTERLEGDVSALDDDVADGTESGLRERITCKRNEILRVKKFSEQLRFLFDEICENDNDLISGEGLKYFEVLRNRSIRLMSLSDSLWEYISQVRESYQAQISIEQNKLMKVFTIVTSIFMPLTLIVGWYGMNLRMPEFGWKYGYPFVALLCVIVGTVWLVIFTKNKWFK